MIDPRKLAEKMGYAWADIKPGFEEAYARLRKQYQHVSNYQLVDWAVAAAKREKPRPSILQQMALFPEEP